MPSSRISNANSDVEPSPPDPVLLPELLEEELELLDVELLLDEELLDVELLLDDVLLDELEELLDELEELLDELEELLDELLLDSSDISKGGVPL